MTVRNELDKAIAMAEASKGNYLLFAADSEDNQARGVFGQMAEDMERHVTILKSRRDYLETHNPLNETKEASGTGAQRKGQQQAKGKG